MSKKKIEQFSLETLRAELMARTQLGIGLEKTLARVSSILEPNPELENHSSDEIFERILVVQKGIYGDDDRKDIVNVSTQEIVNNANAVAAIFRVNDIINNDNGSISIPTRTLGDKFEKQGIKLCSDEPFHGQPSGAICTAFLVKPDIIVTAGHCLNKHNLNTRRFVFGYVMGEEGKAITTLPANNVYMGVDVLGWELDSSGSDWTVVRLDRKVEGIAPLKYRMTGKVNDNIPVYVIGHPIGLPKKFASKAEVRDNKNSHYFVANLDTYGGNSGSPVFNSNTHKVEGILVRGETDFATKENCMASLVCPVQGCRGEDCTRITQAKIPDE